MLRRKAGDGTVARCVVLSVCVAGCRQQTYGQTLQADLQVEGAGMKLPVLRRAEMSRKNKVAQAWLGTLEGE